MISAYHSPPLIAVLVLLAVSSAACAASGSTAAPYVLVEGLRDPRGLALASDGGVLVADVGGGRILRIAPGAPPQVVADGLPVTWDGGHAGDSSIGVSAAVEHVGAIWYVVGEFRGERFRRLYRFDPATAASVAVTDPAPDLTTGVLVNPYDLAVTDGAVYISDAGANTVFHVDPATGALSPLAVLPPSTVQVDARPRLLDAVPTGIALGPDGALYVATLTGWPYPRGHASVLRITTDGAVQVHATGLTALTALAFDADGTLYLAEISNDLATLQAHYTLDTACAHPGRILALRPATNGDAPSVEVVATTLAAPTAVLPDGPHLWVSEEIAGRVTDVRHPQWRSLCD